MAKKAETEKRCQYCAYAQKELYDGNMLCSRRGVVSAGYHCSKYRYDATMRRPVGQPQLPQMEAEDFDLE
ncbi:MAG: hypothetical protein IKD06_01205 [Clostridia bacterium]|nr:hypothetical protein [Clostridia bacterium]